MVGAAFGSGGRDVVEADEIDVVAAVSATNRIANALGEHHGKEFTPG